MILKVFKHYWNAIHEDQAQILVYVSKEGNINNQKCMKPKVWNMVKL